MKIVFPTQEDKGLDSDVFSHFGSARFFVIVDSSDDTFETLTNQDLDHQHGQCQPAKALGGATVDVVVVGGIGGGALRKLQAEGIRAHRAVAGSVRKNLDLIKGGFLPEFEMKTTCGGHIGGGCAHH